MRTTWAESESRGIANQERSVAYVRTEDGTVALWTLPPRATPNEIREAGRQPGLVVLLRTDRYGATASLTGAHVVLFQVVDNLERALFETERDVGNLYDDFAPLLTGDHDHIVIGYTPDTSHFTRAVLLQAAATNIRAVRQCQEALLSDQ